MGRCIEANICKLLLRKRWVEWEENRRIQKSFVSSLVWCNHDDQERTKAAKVKIYQHLHGALLSITPGPLSVLFAFFL